MKHFLTINNKLYTKIKLNDYFNEDSFYKITSNTALNHYYLALSIIKGLENPLARAVNFIINNEEYRNDLKTHLIAATNMVINKYMDLFKTIIKDMDFCYAITNKSDIIYTLKLDMSFKNDEDMYSYKYVFEKKGNDSAKD